MVVSCFVCAGEQSNKSYGIYVGTGYGSYRASLELTFNQPQPDNTTKVTKGWFELTPSKDGMMLKSKEKNATSTLPNGETYGLYMPDYRSGDLISLLSAMKKAQEEERDRCFILNTSEDEQNCCKNVFFEIELNKSTPINEMIGATPPINQIIGATRPSYWQSFGKIVVPIGLLSIVFFSMLLYKQSLINKIFNQPSY